MLPLLQVLQCHVSEWLLHIGRRNTKNVKVLTFSLSFHQRQSRLTTGTFLFLAQILLQIRHQWKGSALCIGTDAKMSTMAKGWSVATMGFLPKMVFEKQLSVVPQTAVISSAKQTSASPTVKPRVCMQDWPAISVVCGVLQCSVSLLIWQCKWYKCTKMEPLPSNLLINKCSPRAGVWNDFAHLLRMLRPKLQAKMGGTVSVPTGASKVQQTTLGHYDPLTIFCGMYHLWTCSWFCGKPWKSMSNTTSNFFPLVLKVLTISKVIPCTHRFVSKVPPVLRCCCADLLAVPSPPSVESNFSHKSVVHSWSSLHLTERCWSTLSVRSSPLQPMAAIKAAEKPVHVNPCRH